MGLWIGCESESGKDNLLIVWQCKWFLLNRMSDDLWMHVRENQKRNSNNRDSRDGSSLLPSHLRVTKRRVRQHWRQLFNEFAWRPTWLNLTWLDSLALSEAIEGPVRLRLRLKLGLLRSDSPETRAANWGFQWTMDLVHERAPHTSLSLMLTLTEGRRYS